MAREIERGATYLDKMCHKLYDEPKGHGFQVDGECRHCGGHLMTYYCEDRLYLIACEKCGALALTKSAAPQVAANLTLRKPTLTQPNEPLTLEELREMNGEPVWGKSLITGKPGEWFILRVVEMSKTWFIACAGAEQGFGDKDTYGETWVAYRRPPEGEKKT